ncbi:hypothetical protein Tco_1211076 [Tanacetum coccineum]
MVVQNQSELGKSLANPTDPYHTPTITQSSTQAQKTQKPRKPKRKDTQVPQPSGPSENVADEAVHKDLGDSLVRAATTASSLESKQDSGNITKIRSKETPNESSSLGTTSGGGPMCQETIGDTIAQTRFKNVSKHSNDSLLSRGNTLRSDKDRLKFNELMELCTNLQTRVLDLEKTKTTQQNKIDREEINAIDADEDITLVNVQDDVDNEMFDAKIKADHELSQRLQVEEQEELSVEEKAKLFQQLLEQRRKHFAAKSAEKKRTKHQPQAQQAKSCYLPKRLQLMMTFATKSPNIVVGRSIKKEGNAITNSESLMESLRVHDL